MSRTCKEHFDLHASPNASLTVFFLAKFFCFPSLVLKLVLEENSSVAELSQHT